MRTSRAMIVFGLALAVGLATAQAQSGTQGHVVMSAADMKWGPAPPGLPAGAQLAVAGSAIFGREDYPRAHRQLVKAFAEAV